MTNDKRQGVLQGLAQLILIRHLRRETGTPSFFYNKVMKRYYLVRVTSGLISYAAAAVLFTVLMKLREEVDRVTTEKIRDAKHGV